MTIKCTTPLNFYRPIDLTGKPIPEVQLTLRKPDSMEGFQKIKMACGKCQECRKSQAREWAVRCCLEMHMHEKSTFLTLTYSPENLPWNGGLDKSHLQNFIKRLRKHVIKTQSQTYKGTGDKHNPDNYEDKKIRFFACGEYGENLSRPHYHVLIFGYDFPDKEVFNQNENGDSLYISESLNKLWPFGHNLIGNASAGSANYIAGYVAKKQNGVKAESHYQSIDKETGECHQIIPEFLTMSTTPGIGFSFYEKYKSDIFPADLIQLRTGEKIVQCPVPYFFYRKLREEDPDLFDQVQAARLEKGVNYALLNPNENDPDRLQTKAFIKRKENLKSVRTLEGEQEKHTVDMTDIYKMQKDMNQHETTQKNNEILSELFSKNSDCSVVTKIPVYFNGKIIKIDEL